MSTIKDVANLSGLSLGTVSNYINGRTVSAENARLIESAIRELDYIPNQIGRSLRSGETKTIGIITKDISAKFISEMTATLEHELSERNYSVIFCNSDMNLQTEQKNINYLIGISVDAIILFPCEYYKTDVSYAVNRNIPVILCDEDLYKNSEKCFKVLFENEKLAYESVKLLIEKGHRNIACLCGVESHYSSVTRISGYKKALAEYGIPFSEDNVFYGDFDNTISFQNTLDYFKRSKGTTAVMITSNNMLVGFLKALEHLNLKAGKDVSYITFAYSEYYEILNPQPFYVFENIEQFSIQLSELVTKILKNHLNPDESSYVYCSASIVEGTSIAEITPQPQHR